GGWAAGGWLERRAVGRSGKVSLEVKTAAELRALRGGGGPARSSHVPRPQAARHGRRAGGRQGSGPAWGLRGGCQARARRGSTRRREGVPRGGAGEETRLAQGQEAEEDSAEWAQGTGHRLRALPERAARADPHAPPGSALSRDHQDVGRRVEQAAANGEAEDSGSGLMNTLLNGHKGGDCDGFSTFDVPIFTEEFLDQNKAREAELRRLRKMNVAFEEQNAVLQRHTQSMSSARERLEQELALEERRTLALQQQLQAVRQALTASFASLPVPGTGETPTLGTLDFYMARLHGAIERDPAQHEKLIVRIKEILAQVASEHL
uniref:High mobility group 20B n=1 Tax=Macaca mulatta TaxID=9544 RepID=A0A5F7ZZG8_MACMU